LRRLWEFLPKLLYEVRVIILMSFFTVSLVMKNQYHFFIIINYHWLFCQQNDIIAVPEQKPEIINKELSHIIVGVDLRKLP
jgi:hypothetical protein